MSNIFDYIEWRDIPLQTIEFNEVDNLILSCVSYFPFDSIVAVSPVTLKQANNQFKVMKNSININMLRKEDMNFFPKIANSKRFGEIKLANYINKVNTIQEKQFSAVTCILPDDTIYISFRGTDNTIIGWKESLNMSFRECIASQIESKKYLEDIAEKYPQKIRLGGHSKGGNLAVYASVFCKEEIKDRIIAVYNNDGPGFHESIVNSPEYEKMLPRIYTFIPQTSIVGRLLEHKERCKFIKSNQTGILQHDLYSWQVLGDKFVEVENTNASKYIDKTITDWLKEINNEQRKTFINILFDILNTTHAKTLTDLNNNKIEKSIAILKAYNEMNEESKNMMSKTLNSLLNIAKSNISIQKNIH